MKAMTALLQREFLEHRGAFLYAPAVLIAVMLVLISGGIVFGDPPSFMPRDDPATALSLLQIAFATVGLIWGAYLIVALYFFYADAFSADQRNNAMLFWKSMPQSDLKILTAKALSGLTVLPGLILAFALMTMVLVYLLAFPLSAKFPLIPIANPLDMLSALFSVGIATAIFLLLSVLWYAPFMALIAGFSVLVKRWAIPATLLFLGALVVSEVVVTYGRSNALHPIRNYLGYRLSGFADEIDMLAVLNTGSHFAPFDLIGELLASIDWFQMGLGVVFVVIVVYLASEYRRRRLET